MKSKIGTACQHEVSRRKVLQGGVAAAVTVAGGMKETLAEQTPKQTLKKSAARAIDIHAHYFPQPYLDLFNAQGFDAEFHRSEEGIFYKTPTQSSGPISVKFTDLKMRLADMDAQGVAVQALSLTGPMSYWLAGQQALELCRTWNDAAIAAHQAYPERFVVLATLPMLDPNLAIDELNRVSRLPGVRGVYIGTYIGGHDLDDPMFAPVFTKIELLDLPVFLHPLAPATGGKRLQPYSLTNLVAFPMDTTIAACHLIFGGVLDRHPKLQVTLPHAGGVLPALIGRLDHGWNVFSVARKCEQTPSAYLRRFTYDIISHSKPLMDYVISQVGVDRIMLGSDYCFDVGYAQPVDFVEELRLSSEQTRKILSGTAVKVLKI
ncbi:MAG: amidohydrolase family protein [Candidatus Acidiferrales bacterium]